MKDYLKIKPRILPFCLLTLTIQMAGPLREDPLRRHRFRKKTISLPFPSQFLEHLFVKDGNSNFSDSVFHFGSDGTEL